MTSSNRFLNRLFLAVVGIVTLAVGAALVLVALPGVAAGRDAVSTWSDAQATALRDTPLTGVGSLTGSSLPWLLAILCLVVIVVAVLAAATRGRGRTDRILESESPAGGIVIGARFAETALEDALSGRRDIAGVNVAAYRLRGSAALKVKVRLAAGAEPGPVVDATSGAVTGLDRVLGGGAHVPVLLEVVGASAIRPGADSRVR
ncbi:hypothetical protein [Frondihabitans australicus]|uniref:Alkaline shock response membrane anchor protein AmaP n=1 Tax=Frondihabitans australicus TaxID=386892 RepID=A0A495IJ96_9MICO|nr:hypothetical protein [Frondihabitans australicus]RKR76092.1 hypothetical protein C8E83_3257 [Frondihabitans australicus]